MFEGNMEALICLVALACLPLTLCYVQYPFLPLNATSPYPATTALEYDVATHPALNFRLRHRFDHTPTSTHPKHFNRTDYSAEDIHAFSPPFQSYTIRRTLKSKLAPQRDQDTVTAWQRQNMVVPDLSHNETLLALAMMTSNAYVDPTQPSWYDVGDRFHMNSSFGMEDDALRGYVFADDDNSTFIITFKGTSARFLWGDGGKTAPKDKAQDNLLFSCCCARVDYTWTPVCGCYIKGNQCDVTCLEKSVSLDTSYYNIAMEVYFSIADAFPNATIWFNGHSLGGAIAALLGLTFGVPTVAFEAPGDRLPAQRLHLPMPPGVDWEDLPIFHVGHTADPIFMGECIGARSSCYYAGFALESKCHLGRVCVYDTVEKLKWRSDIRTHSIYDVIERVLKVWEDGLPECKAQTECVDCELWEFVDTPVLI